MQKLSYQQFARIFIGNLSPQVWFPHKDDDAGMFGVFVKVIAVAIVVMVAPQIAGYALQSAGVTTGLAAGGAATTLGESIAVGVTAALGEAAVQGLSII